MTPPPAQGRTWPALVLPVLLVLTGACSAVTDAGSTTTSPATGTSQPSTTPTTSTETTAGSVDTDAALRAALEQTSPNYRFKSTFEVDGQTLTTIRGVVDGTAVSANIAAGETRVSYVRTDDGEWITEPDGTWVVLEGDAPVAPPLRALSDVSDLALIDGNGTRGEMRGVLGPLAASAHGVEFSVRLRGGRIDSIVYEADIGGETAVVTTRITKVGSAGAVTNPDLG